MSQLGYDRGRYRWLTRWGIEICGEVVSVQEKGDTMKVRVDGEDRAGIWHKTYWKLLPPSI
jgi:hypothetical protein